MNSAADMRRFHEQTALQKSKDKVIDALKNDPLGLSANQLMTVCRLSIKTVKNILATIDVQEVEHKEYIVTENNTLYATKVWDDENQDVSSWEFFNSKDDAEKAAEYCKAMIEAQEPAND